MRDSGLGMISWWAPRKEEEEQQLQLMDTEDGA